jgi:hypothetical protein
MPSAGVQRSIRRATIQPRIQYSSRRPSASPRLTARGSRLAARGIVWLLRFLCWAGCSSQVTRPVGGWRFAPACCAAQSVLGCGPCCSTALHRLAWAACRFVHRLCLLQQGPAHSPGQCVCTQVVGSAHFHQCGLTGRSTGPIAACRHLG